MPSPSTAAPPTPDPTTSAPASPRPRAGRSKSDLRILLVAGRGAGIPVVVTTCGTSGTDSGVDWVADIAQEIAEEEHLSFRMAKIYSELTRDTVLEALASGRIAPLEPAGALAAETVERCEHIVGLMGHEPISRALAAGADLVLTGRASDTASVAGIALGRGIAAGPTWHAAKTVECGEPVHHRPASAAACSSRSTTPASPSTPSTTPPRPRR